MHGVIPGEMRAPGDVRRLERLGEGRVHATIGQVPARQIDAIMFVVPLEILGAVVDLECSPGAHAWVGLPMTCQYSSCTSCPANEGL